MLNYKLFVTTEETLKTKSLLEGFEKQYNLRPYLFTKSVKIKPDVIPHSHPILTLNTFWNDSPNHLLSTFLHEQIHWFMHWIDRRKYGVVHRQFMEWYPELPEDRALISSNTYSTYTHLAICWLELQGVKKYLGADEAYETIRTFKHYPWIFNKVIEDETKIGQLMEENGLRIRK